MATVTFAEAWSKGGAIGLPDGEPLPADVLTVNGEPFDEYIAAFEKGLASMTQGNPALTRKGAAPAKLVAGSCGLEWADRSLKGRYRELPPPGD